jgi:hypothetical protein
MELARRLHLIDHTILADALRPRCLNYLQNHALVWMSENARAATTWWSGAPTSACRTIGQRRW